ncbi:MAG: pseudouridine-5'-phosphate glycosidase [Eubacteriales bacterium]|nr:pseudouridine-5'-phosphate glycosidase [Eubacteriales bacterium]
MPNPEYYLEVSPEVKEALENKRPVVALESTIISHGMPFPKNVETALAVEKVVRDNGAVPATISIINGKLKVGMSEKEINYFGEKGLAITKASRRDIPVLAAKGEDGATTVAATMIIANLAGVSIFCTGGVGGVHRGAETSMDISADLDELAKTPVMVVCAGVKSILDIGKTLEYLETKGVPILGYQTDEFPAFFTRKSGYKVGFRVDSPKEAAAILRAKNDLNLQNGILVANPIPEEYSMNSDFINFNINEAIAKANKLHVTGKDVTPYLLEAIQQATEGKSLDSNIELVFSNATLASKIAVEYSKL